MINKEFGQHNIYVSCDLSYKFWKTAEAFSRFSYQSPWYDSNMRVGRTLRLNIGMSKTFLDGKLRTAIELTDLIGEAVTPRWSIDFSNIKQWQRNRYDTRGVKLTLRYTFNSVSTSFRDAQINKIGEAVTPRWSIDFSNIKQWQRNRYDTRGVKLTIRYTFNSVNTLFRNAQINKSSDGRVD